MTDLSTFAKVRALHDSTTNAGEKASAAARMKTLARQAGMTVDQAIGQLDKPAPEIVAFKTIDLNEVFGGLFNTPEARAHRAARDQRYAERRVTALAEYGSEDAVWAPNAREQALELACRPLVVRKAIIGGEMDTLQGWDGIASQIPPDVQAAVASAYPSPASVRDAWTEYLFWENVADDRVAFWDLYEHGVRVRARTGYVENLLDTLPARAMGDLRARLDWMQHINEREWNRGNPEDGILLATLRADIERMGQRIVERETSHAG